MEKLILSIQLFIIISFLAYGASCILSKKAVDEFKRYKLSHLRLFVGISQITLSLLMCVGFYFKPLLLVSSFGFTVMMIVAIYVRRKLKDSILLTIPSIIYFLLSLFLFYHCVNKYFIFE